MLKQSFEEFKKFFSKFRKNTEKKDTNTIFLQYCLCPSFDIFYGTGCRSGHMVVRIDETDEQMKKLIYRLNTI